MKSISRNSSGDADAVNGAAAVSLVEWSDGAEEQSTYTDTAGPPQGRSIAP
ncbi:hypothetical protein ACWDUD_27250 [Rhodococcus sp. NPDC003382]